MQAYPLQSLLEVRQFREDTAKRDVTTWQHRVAEAQQEVVRLTKVYEDYRVWRIEEEDRRWNALFGTTVDMPGLDRFKAGLSALANQEQTKLDDVNKAKKEEQLTEQRLSQAKVAASNARKATAKIEVHKGIWTEEAKKEAERVEDLEMEEFHPVMIVGQEGDDN